ncbi:hypothetical protein JXA88_02410 [Candidatus Fermentibacteria bacterium]|nr:hypothetical protein [Candidatus Fermentibacteria bacterium]
MREDILAAVVLGVLGILGHRGRDTPGILLTVAGAVVELMADNVIMMAAGGSLVAVGIGLLTGRQQPAIYLAFGSLFLFLVGASVVVTFSKTDSLSLLRVALGAMPPRIGRGALVTIWVALALRTAFLPASLSLLGPKRVVAVIGPAWWSASVLVVRWGGILPQDLLERCQQPCSLLAVGVAVVAGVWAFRSTQWLRVVGAVAAGIGALATLGGWFGGGLGAQGGRMAVFSTAVSGCALEAIGNPAGFLGVCATGIRMLTLGYPLGGAFTARMNLVEGLGGPVTPVGVVVLVFWILPLVGSVRHTAWSHPDDGEARWRGYLAFFVGLLGALEGGPLGAGLTR